jgi:hypothetical protein
MDLKSNPVVSRLLAVNCPFVAVWFPWYWRQSKMASLRKFAGNWIWTNEAGFRRRGVLVIKVMLWPIVGFLGLVVGWLVYSRAAKRISERSRLRQFGELCYFTIWRGFPPRDYYVNRLFLFNLKSVIDDYLSQQEIAILNLSINKGKNSAAINNKYLFQKVCRERKLPIIPTIGIYEKGALKESGEEVTFPPADLYFKPVDGLRGEGIERWQYHDQSKKWFRDDVSLDEDALKMHFQNTSLEGTYLLQEAAVNHDRLSKFSKGGLVTFRIVTTLCPGDAEPEVSSNYMVIPIGRLPTNHGTEGGIVVQMDLQTKTFFSAYKRFPFFMKYEAHPETGAQIKGSELADWSKLAELAVAGHKAFPDIFAIGWDLALTKKGPVIVEANTQWDPKLRTKAIETLGRPGLCWL